MLFPFSLVLHKLQLKVVPVGSQFQCGFGTRNQRGILMVGTIMDMETRPIPPISTVQVEILETPSIRLENSRKNMSKELGSLELL